MMRSKILFILHYPPPIHGAAMMGYYIKNSEFINKKFYSKFIRLGTTSSFEERGKTNFKKIFRYVRLLWLSIYRMFAFSPDLVYMTITSNGVGFYKDAILVLLLKIKGVKFVYHFHNKGIKSRDHKFFDNWLYKKVFKNAYIILLSEYLYIDVEKYIPLEQVYICPNGIPDVSSRQESSRDQQGESIRLLFLSNLLKSKGISILLQACKILKERRLDFRCIFVGGEGDITALVLNKQIAALGLQEEVSYVGEKYNRDKIKMLEDSDIFVHPSWDDCFPLVLLEAMQANLPIVSTLEGGIPSIVQEGVNGFLVPPKDAQALANKLEKLIEDPQKRKEMGKAGRKLYEEKFTVEHFEERMVSILEEIAKR